LASAVAKILSLEKLCFSARVATTVRIAKTSAILKGIRKGK
jgi:hypothetical protein